MSVVWKIALCLGLIAATPVSAGSWRERAYRLPGQDYSGVLPFCDDRRVADKIASRFAQKESEYWHSPLRIVQTDRIRELAYRPWGPSYIPRRFCKARVMTNDGYFRELSYAIAEDQGMIGMTWGVEWCVDGVDRHLAFAPNCKMARP